MGKTAIGYIQERRMQMAQYLLKHSTLPIKSIAAEVGMPDLHQFNKTFRRILKEAPTGMRRKMRETGSAE
jgi:transcriptional regulator GlxA family with amidase domain